MTQSYAYAHDFIIQGRSNVKYLALREEARYLIFSFVKISRSDATAYFAIPRSVVPQRSISFLSSHRTLSVFRLREGARSGS